MKELRAEESLKGKREVEIDSRERVMNVGSGEREREREPAACLQSVSARPRAWDSEGQPAICVLTPTQGLRKCVDSVYIQTCNGPNVCV